MEYEIMEYKKKVYMDKEDVNAPLNNPTPTGPAFMAVPPEFSPSESSPP